MRYLSYLEGTKITLNSPPVPPFFFQTETWVIDKEISEHHFVATQEDLDDGLDPGQVAGKFSCHTADPTSQQVHGFIRVRKQIPTAGSEFNNASIRAAQAVPASEPNELSVMLCLKEHGSDVAPKLLGYQLTRQGEEDIVPGGYMTYVAWEKVPGESLNLQQFWNSSFQVREDIRNKFRPLWEYVSQNLTQRYFHELTAIRKLTRIGYRLSPPTSHKVIYDWDTGTMYVLCG